MGEREWWSNVYGPFPTCGIVPHRSRKEADDIAQKHRIGCVHVRLKPEGAPKRYINAENKAAWERDAHTSRQLLAMGRALFFSPGGGVYAGSPRTPQIEERT
jgi:hypothetical protein